VFSWMRMVKPGVVLAGVLAERVVLLIVIP
jgi:hypothetical protein